MAVTKRRNSAKGHRQPVKFEKMFLIIDGKGDNQNARSDKYLAIAHAGFDVGRAGCKHHPGYGPGIPRPPGVGEADQGQPG